MIKTQHAWGICRLYIKPSDASYAHKNPPLQIGNSIQIKHSIHSLTSGLKVQKVVINFPLYNG